ncbi:hypothetical protein ACI2KX_15820 [Ectopseudomonas khazarica]|uniref:hypothetical protein n=1 Tax=Ectopseudomonas khazarica TaxID=2502979 RepID=UPI00384CD515
MPINYSVGRYLAYGAGTEGPQVGWVEDGYLRSANGTWSFRIDGQEIYGPGGDFVGFIDNGVATRARTGQFLFRLERE